MGRLHHLVETLPKNICWNLDYSNLEFVILDYNSPDGLGDWIKKYMINSINSGIVVYYKYFDSPYFRYSHSRNLLLRLASGNIVCNLDADNYTGKGFAGYIERKLRKIDFIAGPIITSNNISPRSLDGITMGCFGRIAIRKDLVLSIGGYNEELEYWGFEDRDLYMRLRALKFKSDSIDPQFLFSIPHTDEERGFNLTSKDSIGTGSHLFNEMKSHQLIKNGKYILNNGEIGCGIVYKNFSTDPIFIEKLK